MLNVGYIKAITSDYYLGTPVEAADKVWLLECFRHDCQLPDMSNVTVQLQKTSSQNRVQIMEDVLDGVIKLNLISSVEY